MKRSLLLIVSISVLVGSIIGIGKGQEGKSRAPEFTSDNRLVRPKDYREWIYVSSGLGMTYGPAARAQQDSPPLFDNVFVEPSAFRCFLQTGQWPDKTIFVLEVRSSSTQRSINKGGNFQDALVAVEAEVKDEARFSEKWAYFSFGENGPLRDTASALSKEACYSCHYANGAVENTFTQFYPTLLLIANTKGTLNPGYKPNSSSD